MTTTDLARKPRTSAERQARYRVRNTLGLLLARTEIMPDLAQELIDGNLLSEAGASDPEQIGAALVRAARLGLKASSRITEK